MPSRGTTTPLKISNQDVAFASYSARESQQVLRHPLHWEVLATPSVIWKRSLQSGTTPWTLDEDRKLEELYRKGLKLGQIISEMGNRTYGSCVMRLRTIQGGYTRPKEGKMAYRHWTAEEEALLLEKQRQGLPFHQIATYFPGRNTVGVSKRLQNLKSWNTTEKPTELMGSSDAVAQRMIDMRLKEAKTIMEIAAELKTSFAIVEMFWQRQCVPKLSNEMQDTLKWRKAWKPVEMKHLLELHRRGTLCIRDVALQFPTKTLSGVRTKCTREHLRFPMFSKEPEVSVPIKSEKSPGQYDILQSSQAMSKSFSLRKAGKSPAYISYTNRGRTTNLRSPRTCPDECWNLERTTETRLNATLSVRSSGNRHSVPGRLVDQHAFEDKSGHTTNT